MNRPVSWLILLFVIGGCFPHFASAQDAENGRVEDGTVQDYVEIELSDGSRFVGSVLSENESQIQFRTVSGLEITLELSAVVSRRTIRARLAGGELVRLDPTSSRLFFGATGRPLTKGGGYLAAYELFFSLAAYGVSDDVIVSGGITLFPFSPVQIYYIAPKVTVYNENDRSVALGVLAGGITTGGGVGGILYGVSTIGPPDRAVSAGAGFLFGGGEVKSTPVILFGFERQLSSKIKLISENYAFPWDSSEILFSGGVRFIGGRLTTDLAGFTILSSLDEGGIPFLPWLSFTYHFGN